MNIQTARAIIADSSLAPSQADWMLAGRVLYEHWQKHPEALRPTRLGGTLIRDRPVRTTCDAGIETPLATGTGTDPTSGPERIMKLRPPGTAYSVLTDNNGEVWLCRHAEVEGSGSNGQTTMGDRQLARAQAAQAQRAQGAKFAAELNEKAQKRWGR